MRSLSGQIAKAIKMVYTGSKFTVSITVKGESCFNTWMPAVNANVVQTNPSMR